MSAENLLKVVAVTAGEGRTTLDAAVGRGGYGAKGSRCNVVLERMGVSTLVVVENAGDADRWD